MDGRQRQADGPDAAGQNYTNEGGHKKVEPKQHPDSAGAEGILGRLTAVEESSVLQRLLEQHPELRSEAESIAAAVLSELSFEDVAYDVEEAVLQFDYGDLNARAGKQPWGYVEPGEAAWEMLEEAVEPFLEEMKRYHRLGFEEQALETCKGILLGLYRVRDGGDNDVLGWAEDFPAEAAGNALEEWSKMPVVRGQTRIRLPGSFAAEYLPEWGFVRKWTDRSQ